MRNYLLETDRNIDNKAHKSDIKGEQTGVRTGRSLEAIIRSLDSILTAVIGF